MAKVTKTVKRTTVKKSGKTSAELKNLAAELKSLIPKLDEEGLAFLVKQAHVHLYNMQVDALNQTMIKDEQRKSKTVEKPKKVMKTDGHFDIKISETGAGYHIKASNTWVSFTTKEVTTMVKIVKGEGSNLEIRERLYKWLAGERADFLSTASIADKFDSKLTALINLLNENFKLKS